MTPYHSAERGFESLPPRFLSTLPDSLSQGARLTLLVLWQHCNRSGTCFLLYRTIAAHVKRTKASVSSYIRELREHGLVETERTMRHGQNRNLIFKVAGYAEHRASIEKRRSVKQADNAPALSGQSATPSVGHKAERRVQPAERRNPKQDSSKQDSVSTDSDGGQVQCGFKSAVVKELLDEWACLARGTQWPFFNDRVPNGLVAKTRNWLESFASSEPLSANMTIAETASRLRELWSDLGVAVSDGQLEEQCQAVLDQRCNEATRLGLVLSKIRSEWNPHWRRASSGAQVSRVCASVVLADEPLMADCYACLDGYVRRLETQSRLSS